MIPTLRPYNPSWIRHFDLAMPSLPLISTLTPTKIINFLRGTASGKVTDTMNTGETITTTLGGIGKVETGVSKSIRMQWGDMRDVEQTYTLKNVHKDLMERLGQYRFNTSIVGMLYEVKGIFADTEKFPTLDGVENIYLVEQSSGNFTHTFRRQLGFRRISDPFPYLKHKIVSQGILPTKQFSDLHIRSIIGTRSIAGIEGGEIKKGYTDLQPDLYKILATIKGQKFWECTGKPLSLDSFGVIYQVNEQELVRDGLETLAFGPQGFAEQVT